MFACLADFERVKRKLLGLIFILEAGHHSYSEFAMLSIYFSGAKTFAHGYSESERDYPAILTFDGVWSKYFNLFGVADKFIPLLAPTLRPA
jgi:hypothetical protein